MNRSIHLAELLGFAATSLLGTLLHFAYDLFGASPWVAPFSAVNESTWEHMKLLFFPMFLFALAEWFFFRDRADFFCIKLRGTLLGLTLIPVLFYTYNGVIGKSPDWINIAIFFIAAAAAYLSETRRFMQESTPCPSSGAALTALILLAGLFVLFTFVTPHIGIFLDPVTGGYGIPAN